MLILFLSIFQPMLTDNRGFAYHQKIDKRRANVTWRCTHRGKPQMCRASVVKRKNRYVLGVSGHICQSMPNREIALVSIDICKQNRFPGNDRVTLEHLRYEIDTNLHTALNTSVLPVSGLIYMPDCFRTNI